MCPALFKHPLRINSSNPHSNPVSQIQVVTHLIDEETEVQRGKATCPRSHRGRIQTWWSDSQTWALTAVAGCPSSPRAAYTVYPQQTEPCQPNSIIPRLFSVTPQIYNQPHKTLQLGRVWRTGPPATHPPGFLPCKLISKGQRVGRFLKGPDLSGCEAVEEGCQAVFPTLRERQTSGPTLIFDQRLLAQRVLLAEKSLYGVLVLNRTACFNYQSHNPLHCQFV